MARAPRYYMLVASLPPLPPLFADAPPISRLRLDKRLDMLEPDHRRALDGLQDLMRWDRLPLEVTDREIIERAHDFLPLVPSATLRDVATWRLELRTVVAGLRRREMGRPPPERGEMWGYGRWVRQIQHNWTTTDFGLGGIMPWVAEFAQLMSADDTRGFERRLLDIVWRHMSRAADRHYFDFEAVALYVLRWDIVARWSAYDGRLAQDRFDRLVADGLAEYAELFETSPGARRGPRATAQTA